ncbi:hypothetical protein KC327_g69 [Hortaea werneckii]|nr:hypothetical protein KC327_g69 [Hortaea werneckii]
MAQKYPSGFFSKLDPKISYCSKPQPRSKLRTNFISLFWILVRFAWGAVSLATVQVSMKNCNRGRDSRTLLRPLQRGPLSATAARQLTT